MKPLAQRLFERLERAGVDCTFGIPGDFALPLYAAQNKYGMRTVVCTHEPNAVFAAIAYARIKGLGIVLTTYGVGGLNMINPMAMAYAEFTPVLVISGAPEIGGRTGEIQVHHLVKDYESQRRVFDEVTVATAVLDNSDTAATEIDRIIQTVVRQKRPGYLEIPRDMTNIPIADPGEAASPPPEPEFNEETLAEALGEIRRLISEAKKPVLYVGVGVRRQNLVEEVTKLAEAWGMAVVSSVMGKGTFPETHSNFVGLFMGEMGDAAAQKAVQESDCVLSVGVINSDVNTGFETGKIPHRKLIVVAEQETLVFHHRYENLPMGAFITALAEAAPAQQKPFVPAVPTPEPAATPKTQGPLRIEGVIRVLKGLDPSQYSFLADVGDAWFIGLELQTDFFIASGYYGTMGFAVPGGLGAGIAAPERLPLVIVGDGAFQMTGAEIAVMRGLGLKAIVLVLNNATYKMLEALDGPRDYYNIQNWDYVGFARALGCEGERVTTETGLQDAIAKGKKAKTSYLIEAIVDKEDYPPILKRFRDFFAAKKAQA